MSEQVVYAPEGAQKTRMGRIVAWLVTLIVLELITLIAALIINKFVGAPVGMTADKRSSFELRGYLIALGMPSGLGPPFIAAALALLVGLPMQRAATRAIHAIQVPAGEAAQLMREMHQMGDAARDPSRTGRLVAALVSVALFEVVTLLVVLVVSVGFGVGKGTGGALGPNPAGALLVVTLGAVIGAAPPFIALLASVLPGLKLHRNATKALSKVSISESEREQLLAEMAQSGAPIRERDQRRVTATLTSSAIAIAVTSLFVVIGAVVLGLLVDKGIQPGFGPALAILVLSPIGFAPPFIPILAGYFAGRGSFRTVTSDPADSLPITAEERSKLEGELASTEKWIASHQWKRRVDILIACVVTYLVMMLVTVIGYFILAAFIPMMRIPGSAWPAYILLLLPPAVCVPPFLPLVIGLLAGMPLRRRVREASPMFMG